LTFPRFDRAVRAPLLAQTLTGVVETTRTLAADTAHLARLPRDDPYPAA
jgi:hypothetical protein